MIGEVPQRTRVPTPDADKQRPSYGRGMVRNEKFSCKISVWMICKLPTRCNLAPRPTPSIGGTPLVCVLAGPGVVGWCWIMICLRYYNI